MANVNNKHIIVIPFNLPWDWSTDYTNQTASVLGKENFVICYMWCDYLSLKEYFVKKKFPILIKKFSMNVYLFYPILFIPFRRFSFIVGLNEKLNLVILNIFIKFLSVFRNINKKVLWIFDPHLNSFTKNFGNAWYVIYDCVDYFIATGASQSEKKVIARDEIFLTKHANFVAANSQVLKKHLNKIRDDVVLVPQGFRVDSFKNYSPSKSIASIKRGTRPLIGFVGAVNGRIEYTLLYALAINHPEWDFALWGKKLEIESFTLHQSMLLDKLEMLPNIIRGQCEKSEIPGIVSQFDIGIIPYDPKNDFNKYCYPMKLFEFFYLGKPVLSTEIEELKRFPGLVYIGNTKPQWEKIITKLLKTKWPQKNIEKEKKMAIHNSWESKVSQILASLR